MKKKKISTKTRLYTSFLLVLLALVALTAATVAWFSIADNTKVNTMSLDIVAGTDLRMDLDPHPKFEDYVKTLSFETIATRIKRDKGFSMKEVPLEPVTTSNYKVFTYENGQTVSVKSGAYLEFTLHFIAEKDMLVHLTSANSKEGAGDGTLVTSKNPNLPKAMRIAFSADGKTWVYNPGMGDASKTSGKVKTFGLPGASQMTLTKKNSMFSLVEGQDKPILVHIWMEGTDPACTDQLRAADYAIRLRFTGETIEEKKTNESRRK